MGKKDKKAAKGGLAAGLGGAALGQIVSEFAGTIVKSGIIEKFIGPNGKGRELLKAFHRNEEAREDVIVKLLNALRDHGPMTLPELLNETKLGLTRLLRALRDTREFRLVESFGDDEDQWRLTKTGERTVAVLGKHGIRKKAAKLLEG